MGIGDEKSYVRGIMVRVSKACEVVWKRNVIGNNGYTR